MADGITISEGTQEDAEIIESRLLEALRHELPQSLNTGFVLCARTKEGNLVAGLSAATSYGWAAIKTLWVADAFRGTGLARELMREAEERASALGCHSIWLDTSNPDARGLYEHLGYEVFGELANGPGREPSTHRRWFLKKSLAGSAGR